MIRIDTLIRTKRKSLSLHITPHGNLVVKAPERMPISVIESFITKKEVWINASRQKVLANLELNSNLINCNDVLYCGKTYPVIFTSDVKQVILSTTACLIPIKITHEKKELALKKWYLKASPEIVLPRIIYFANLMQVHVNSVKFTNAAAKWGSCDSKSDIRLNWRLVMLPPNLIDYIIVHELAHLIELNHSQNFWRIVGSIMPEYKQHVKDTKKSGFLLQLFR